ncbi:hypothetical protein PG993_010732 [Apiospora rasikravindrae]|uniref:Transposase n=1 Tax=Apiospora rasikravindrae TaxID=990691 RepID=A0ABR1SC54_9PEZI
MANHGRTWLAFCRVAVSVQTWLRDELRDKLGQDKRDRRARSPPKSLERGLFRGHARADAKGAECYAVISPRRSRPDQTLVR